MNLLYHDNAIFRVLGKIADVFVLDILFIICSIPVITIGSSATALYDTTLKLAEGSEGYIVTCFFASFRKHVKKSTVLWSITLFFGICLWFDSKILMSGRNLAAFSVLLFVTILYIMMLQYLFACLVRYQGGIGMVFKNAFVLCIRHLPYSIMMSLLMICILIIMVNRPIVVLFGFSLIAYINSCVLVRIFGKY